MDAFTQMVIVFYSVVAFGLVLGLLGVKYLKPQSGEDQIDEPIRQSTEGQRLKVPLE